MPERRDESADLDQAMEPDAPDPGTVEADGSESATSGTDPAEMTTASGRRAREPKPGSRMTEQEQQWGKWLGLGSAAGFAVLAQPWLGGEHLIQSGLGVALGMLLWSVARQGFRIRTAIASYLFLFAFGDLFIFGALHIGYAFLLAFRSSREMGQARAEARAQGKSARAGGAARSGRRRKAKGRGDADGTGPAEAGRPRVAEPNRRYTPPKPKKKRRGR